MGDEREGDEVGDDEKITINLAKLDRRAPRLGHALATETPRNQGVGTLGFVCQTVRTFGKVCSKTLKGLACAVLFAQQCARLERARKRAGTRVVCPRRAFRRARQVQYVGIVVNNYKGGGLLA